MICPKCGHERNSTDNPLIPDYKCPACGIIYAKYAKYNQPGFQSKHTTEPILNKDKKSTLKIIQDKLITAKRNLNLEYAKVVASRRQTKKTAQESKQPKQIAKEKSLPLAIGLNFLFPGLGYMYMGNWIVGVLGGLLIIGIYMSSGLLFVVPSWITMNIIMVIDMLILSNKNKKKVMKENMKECPECAELILKKAKVCRFCGAKFPII
jgi:predicted RNA-binding Zn-ribbon protein involved in translation (DUF1610 family)